MSIDRRSLMKGIGSVSAAYLLPFRFVYAGRADRGYPRLLQGPMLGAIEPARARIWVRTSDELPVQVEYGSDPGLGDSRRTEAVTAVQENDRTAVVTLDRLEPGQHYYYRVLVDGSADKYIGGQGPFQLCTAPAEGEPARFRVAFGSCARFEEEPTQPIWAAVQTHNPDLFFWLGDNIYSDSLVPEVLAESYRRQRSVPGFQPVGRNVPQLAIWDDHDYGLNDHDRTSPVKDEALAAFRRYWANPGYGTAGVPGVFFHYRYGGVDFFFLDCRYYRDPNSDPDQPGKTMLGNKQMEWLKGGLAGSDAPFKVLVSGSGWTKAKGPGGDSWASFVHERDVLFDFIRDESISGVVLVSGDTHVGELNAIPRSERGGYDLYDLVSSPLAQPPSASWLLREPEVRLRVPYMERSNFGSLDFDLTGEVPRLRFNLIGDNGERAWSALELRADELVNGIESWRGKVDSAVQNLPPAVLPERQRG